MQVQAIRNQEPFFSTIPIKNRITNLVKAIFYFITLQFASAKRAFLACYYGDTKPLNSGSSFSRDKRILTIKDSLPGALFFLEHKEDLKKVTTINLGTHAFTEKFMESCPNLKELSVELDFFRANKNLLIKHPHLILNVQCSPCKKETIKKLASAHCEFPGKIVLNAYSNIDSSDLFIILSFLKKVQSLHLKEDCIKQLADNRISLHELTLPKTATQSCVQHLVRIKGLKTLTVQSPLSFTGHTFESLETLNLSAQESHHSVTPESFPRLTHITIPSGSEKVEKIPGCTLSQGSFIRTERLFLRPWKESDFEFFADLGQDPKVMEFFPNLITRERSLVIANKFKDHFEEKGWGLFSVEIPGVEEFIGFIGLNPIGYDAHFTPATEVGWRLAPAHWGKGYATEGAKAALDYGFEEFGLTEIVSCTTPLNAASVAIMKKIGMTHDPKENFERPTHPKGHPLRPHVLYRARRP